MKYFRFIFTFIICFFCCLFLGDLSFGGEQDVQDQKFRQYLEYHLIPRYGADLTKAIFQESAPQSPQMISLMKDRTIPNKENQYLLFLAIERSYATQAADYFRHQFLEYARGLSNISTKEEFLEIDRAISKINDVRAKRQLYFELFRSLAFYYDIASFHHDTFLNKQLSLSQLALKVVIQCELRPKVFLPTLPTDSSTFFVFEDVGARWLRPNMIWADQSHPPYPFAVFKTGRELREEKALWEIQQSFFHHKVPFISPSMQNLNGRQFAWETAYLFGFADFFMPTQMIEIYGQLGCVQPYWPYLHFPQPVPYSKDNADAYARNVSKIASKPFYACCLGSLLLSLYDQSFENCRYKQLDDGTLSILNFDDGCAFPSRNGFIPLYQKARSHEKKQLVALNRTFWAWYFDFPQAKTVLKGSDLAFVQKLIAPWPDKFNDFLAYLHHPLNNFFLEKEEDHVRAFKERLDRIKQIIMNPDEEVSMMKILYQILPSYEILIENMTKIIPMSAASPMSVMGYPNMNLTELEHWLGQDLQVPEEEVQNFLDWYHQFAASL